MKVKLIRFKIDPENCLSGRGLYELFYTIASVPVLDYLLYASKRSLDLKTSASL